jgi:hypothetical protein
VATYSIEGSIIEIGATLVLKQADFIAADFTAALTGATIVGEPETFGAISDEWELEEFKNATTGRTTTHKTGRKGKAIELVFGLDPNDAGQIAMRAACAAKVNYAFRFTFADRPTAGAAPKNSTRVFVGLVVACEDDPSGKIGKVKFTIQPNSNVLVTNASAT